MFRVEAFFMELNYCIQSEVVGCWTEVELPWQEAVTWVGRKMHGFRDFGGSSCYFLFLGVSLLFFLLY